ncbi:Prophage integrase IntS [Oligella sp. MSHR50489EDL]|uniref:tyrosine-type recombinase/integrase n=1 Tax=Oligella sp. MSHR50489EDL TaxID=3139409 RepID=UPI003D8148D4
MLTDRKIKALETPQKGIKKHFDNAGLYLQINSKGQKYWRYQYYRPVDKKKDVLALGVYPAISLKEARNLRNVARALLDERIDPKEEAKRKKRFVHNERQFATSAEEWYKNRANDDKRWSDKQKTKMRGWLNNHILPAIGSLPIDEITPMDVLQIPKKLENQGKTDTANRILPVIERIFQYAITMRRCKYNPAVGLKDEIETHKAENFPHFTDRAQLHQLLNDIDNSACELMTRMLLKVLPYLFSRPTEVRSMRWADLDFNNKLWIKPGNFMKNELSHLVPLAPQVIKLLLSLKEHTGHSEYVFYNPRSKTYLSENAAGYAMNRMGYKDKFSPHGWRHVASTLLHEHGFDTLWIEKQLAHKDKNKVRAIYNHAEYLEQRRKMMNHWADYIDSVRKSPTE